MSNAQNTLLGPERLVLDLNGDMVDLKLFRHNGARVAQKRAAPRSGPQRRHGRHGIEARRDGPDMEIMDGGCALDPAGLRPQPPQIISLQHGPWSP